MKSLLLSLLGLCLLTGTASSTDVSLRITYNNQAVCNYDITLKHGDVAIGQGKTDSNGDVTFSGVSLMSKSVDVHGIKKSANGEKKFDLQGYVTLNEDNYAHIQMEKIVQEAASGSGFPESMMAAAWGLTDLDCGGTSSGGNGGATIPANSDRVDAEEEEAPAGTMASAEQTLEMQEAGYRNEIAMLERKIQRKEEDLNEMKTAGVDQTDVAIAEYELEELRYKKQRKEISLARVIREQDGPLTPEERAKFRQDEEAMKAGEEEMQSKQKAIEKSKKEAARAEKEGESGGGMDKAKTRMEIASLKSQIKLKESSLHRGREKGELTETEIAEREAELAELRSRLELLQGSLGE